jgi:hypothetical protein
VWFHIEYERMSKLPTGLGRFHATWNRENPTQPVGSTVNTTLHTAINDSGTDNFVVLDAAGHGSLVGIFLNIDNTTAKWYGEGDDMIFIDGEKWPPSYHGTGSEEIFGGGACPTAEYAGPYTGFHLIGNLDYSGKISMYRFYVNDPVRFRKSIRMTIEHGHANNFGNDYSSTAFWYQAEPHQPFGALPPALARRPRDGSDPHDRAFAQLIALRPKLLTLWSQSVRTDRQIPQSLQQAFKYDISQTYFRRDYQALMTQVSSLETQVDALLNTPPSQ